MTELERALVALGYELDFPHEPNIVAAVRDRLAERRRFAFAPSRRVLAVAVALVVVAFGIAMAVPQARSAILRFFHIGAASVERVETLPRAEHRPLQAGLGPPLSRAVAEQRAHVQIRLPELAGSPPSRYYAQPGLVATLLHYRGKAVLLAEMLQDQVSITKKFVSPRTQVEPANIGEFGLWIQGGEHVIRWQFGAGEPRTIQTRLAGNVLLWLESGRTYRLEGQLDKRQMLRLARNITP
jgi:hypothetical protein